MTDDTLDSLVTELLDGSTNPDKPIIGIMIDELRGCEAMAMNDNEFLAYCALNARAGHCGFLPEQLARLCRLAGQPALADFYDHLAVIYCEKTNIQTLVAEAQRTKR